MTFEMVSLLIVASVAAGALAALAVVAVLGVSAYSAHTVVRPNRGWQPEDWRPPDPAREAVRFANAAGQRIDGWYVPPSREGAAVILVCHGFGTNRREGQDLLQWLEAAGYGVLLFDFQAHGDSEGRYTTVGLREVEDTLAAVRYVQEREGQSVPLFGLGFSMGASVLIIAAARSAAFRALFLDSPFATLRRAISRSFRLFFRLPPRIFTRPTIWFAERLTGARVGEHEPIREIASIAPRPIAIVQGTEDAIVDPEDSLLLYEAAHEPKALWRVEGVGHVGVRFALPDEYRERVLAFFARAERSLDALDGGTDAM